MLLSRFWYFLLAAVFGTTLTAALLAQAIFNRQYDAELATQLRRDRVELELWLRLDARSRLDAIAPLAAHGDVRTALRKANARKEPHVDPALRRELEGTLRTLNKQLDEMRGDLVFAVDQTGIIVAQLGAGDPPAGAGLGAFPLVHRALTGHVRDDVWVYNNGLYRMAARPVIDRGEYVGALVHGMTVDDKFAQRLGDRLPGASVGFFRGPRMLATHMPAIEHAARAPEMEGLLAEVLEDPEVQKGGRTDPLEVGDNARAVYSLMAGSAAHAGAGYGVARPRYVLASPFQIFDRASSQDVEDLPWLLVAGLPLLLFGLAMLWVWLERDRPLVRLRDTTRKLADKGLDRADISHFRGRYRQIVENVNQALDKAMAASPEGGSQRRAADLDQLLGPAPDKGKGGGYFGFAAEENKARDEVPSFPPPPGTGPRQKVPAPPAAPNVPMPGAPPPGGEPTTKVPTRPMASDAEPTAKHAAPPPAAAAPRPPAAPKPPAAPPKAPPRAPAPPSPAPKPAATAARPAPAPAPPPAAAPDWDEDDEGATMVAERPEELLQQAAADEEEAHFRETFEQYVAMKEKCGESTAGLTFDKFSQTLRKNRDQIVARHDAKGVRFSVYEKNGKAALKAAPVKD
jgi:hypothetical protein